MGKCAKSCKKLRNAQKCMKLCESTGKYAKVGKVHECVWKFGFSLVLSKHANRHFDSTLKAFFQSKFFVGGVCAKNAFLVQPAAVKNN